MTTAQTSKLPFAEAVAFGGALYLSGQVGIDPATGLLANGSFKAEADQVMKNLGSVLQKNGLSYSNLINVTIYLTSMEHYSATNEVYRSYFDDLLPGRVCIAVSELPLKARIEIAAIAGKPQNI